MKNPNRRLALEAIPVQRGVEGWRDVPIHECFESLVPLAALRRDRVAVAPAYHLAGLKGALSQAYLREDAAERLIGAAGMLPAGLRLAVLDAWRPLDVQTILFNRVMQENRKLHPKFSKAKLEALSERIAARPIQKARAPYPHSTGGALDVTIMGESGKLIEMGTCHDDISECVPTRYYEEQLELGIRLSARARQALKNRRTLFHALRARGFTNYHLEWWHFDYGNQFWAVQENTFAKYGRISLSNG